MPAGRNKLIGILREITSLGDDEILRRISRGVDYSRDKYIEFINSGGSNADFYIKTDGYIFELVNWENDAYKIGLAKYAASLFPRQTPVLDFGCGIGTVLQDFAEAGFTSLDGIDVNELNRRFTIKRFESMEGVSCGVYGEISSVHAEYGIIVSLHVLEHLEDPAHTMEDLSARLAVNGLFFGVAPFNLTGGNFPEHRIENKNLKLEKMAENAGLRVLDKVPFGSFDGEPFELVVAQKKR